MKKLFAILLCMAVLISCTPGVINNDSSREEPSDNAPESTDPSDDAPQSTDPSAEAFNPSGCVKTITKESWRRKSSASELYRSSVVVTTITWDSQGRPEKEDIVEYGYDESGELLPDGFGVLNRAHYFFYSPGKMEIRQHPEESAVIYKADLNDQGLIIHYENGDAFSGSWRAGDSGDCVYENGFLTGIEDRTDKLPWYYSWSADGNLIEARQKWDTFPEEVTDDETKYYFYGATHNITLGTNYDVSCMLIDNLDPYGFMGRGTELLPEYANSTYRNKSKEFDYQFSRTGPLEKVTVVWRPFANEGGDWLSVEFTYIYSFEYYE